MTYTKPVVSIDMCQFRFVPIVTLAVALAFPASDSICQSMRQKNYPRDMTVSVPRFSVTVTFSTHARQRLESIHESVLVIVYFDGDPLPGQGRDNAPFRDVFLGNDKKMADEQNVATFDTAKVSQSNWDRLADKDYFVTINVVSARKSSKSNLLWCAAPENRLSAFAGKTTEVSCDLIGERFPALKALGNSPK